jgi:predicted CXXCH cytochrome family protein
LWNKDIQAQTYNVYTSPTLIAGKDKPLPQPTGPTKLCLSCHDGTIALGTIVGNTNLGLNSKLSSGSSYFGLDLSTHHPISFPYGSAQPESNPELVPINLLPATLVLGGPDAMVHCTTCHDPHDDSYGQFLVMDNSRAALCTSCHQMSNWNFSGHASLEKGCEVCHTAHFARATPLLNYTSSDFCLTCHSSGPPPAHVVVLDIKTASDEGGAADIRSQISIAPGRDTASGCAQSCHSLTDVTSSYIQAASLSSDKSLQMFQSPPISMAGRADIKGQMMKRSGHHEQSGINDRVFGRSKRESRSVNGNVTCVDCHNPHAANRQTAYSPYASGMLKGVRGIDRNGIEVASATYEYEVCFKCHADNTADIQFIPRVIGSTNMRLLFDTANPSYHPVVGMGKNVIIPSLPSSFNPRLQASDVIYCTDCHGDDAGGSKGPHGSSFAPILRERYETGDYTPESPGNYALCYRCHNRDSIMRDDSFRKNLAGRGGHSGHLAKGTPCSVCHDPHGVTDNLLTGSHTHLINFDIRIVLPKPGTNYPIFNDAGIFSGGCTLLCHGRLHDNETYPQNSSSIRQTSPKGNIRLFR